LDIAYKLMPEALS